MSEYRRHVPADIDTFPSRGTLVTSKSTSIKIFVPSISAPSTFVILGVAALTVMLQEAVFPFTVVAVISAVPLATARTVPLSTVAIFCAELVQTTVLSLASAGSTVAISVSLSPISIVNVVLLSDTEVTSTTSDAGSLTVTVQIAILPLCAVAVIVAAPSDLAVTFPLLTAATEESVLDHIMLLSVALLGETVATSV